MRIGANINTSDIYSIIQILNSYVGEEVKLETIILKMLRKNIGCSDILFLILEKLERDGIIRGRKNVIYIKVKINNNHVQKIVKYVMGEIQKNKRLFVTPLEVGKFYQCPRRLFLEKVVMAKEHKETRGKIWDGIAIHYAINLLIKNLNRMDESRSIYHSLTHTFKKYKNRITVGYEEIRNFLMKIYETIKKEKFSIIFAEKTFQSLKVNIIGTPDLVGIKENEIIPIDIKLGRFLKNVKEEHLIQIVGESILVENFFRKKIKMGYIIYFKSNSIVKIEIENSLKKRFLELREGVERMCTDNKIPEVGRIKNLERRVCAGCHVKSSCENIEELRKIKIMMGR